MNTPRCYCSVYSATAEIIALWNSNASGAFLSQSDEPSCSNLNHCCCHLTDVAGVAAAAMVATVAAVIREACY